MSFVPQVFSHCRHPRRLIINDVVRYMPCGKCEPCLQYRASSLRARVANEANAHKYIYFITLTYKNDFVPLCSWSDYFGRFMRNDIKPLGTSLQVSNYLDKVPVPSYAENQMLPGFYNKYSYRPWISNFVHRDSQGVIDSRNHFAVVSLRDCQLFLKRLRKNLSSEYNREQRRVIKFKLLKLKVDFGYTENMSVYRFNRLIKNNREYEKKKKELLSELEEVRKYRSELLRYFLCAEYGPKTYRPHYHVLVFCNDETVSRLLPAAVAKSWPFSLDTTRPVEQVESTSRAVSYVSKYVTGNTDLPRILREKCTRTFYLASRRPCFGTISFDYEKVRSYYYRGTIFDSVPVYDKDGKLVEFADVRIPKSVLSRYFPKCSRFESLSYRDKLSVYSRFFGLSGETEKIIDDTLSHFVLYPRYDRGIDNRGILKDENYLTFYFQDVLAARACRRWCKHFNCLPEDYLKILDWFDYQVKQSLLRSQYVLAERYSNVCYDDVLLRDLPPSVGYMLPGPPLIQKHYSFDFVQSALDYFRWNSDLSRGIENMLGLDVGFFYHDDGNLDKDAVNRFLDTEQSFYKDFLSGVLDKMKLSNKSKNLNDVEFLHKSIV